MCTLIAFWRTVPGFDLVLGMNRDESAVRPAEPPAFLGGEPAVVAPRDLRAGGTWLGVNGAGLAIALSNRRGRTSQTAKSRGQLVLEALREKNVRGVGVYLERTVRDHEYNFWNLMAMTRDDLRFFHYDGRIASSRGHEGVNVLTNDGANAAADPKVLLVGALIPKTPPGSLEGAIRLLQTALRTHAPAGGGPSLCLHFAGGGTVSSTILALSNASAEENILLYADGAPCSNPYRDLNGLVRRLRIG